MESSSVTDLSAIDGCPNKNEILSAIDGCLNKNDILTATEGCLNKNEILTATDGCPNENEILTATDGCPNENEILTATNGCPNRNEILSDEWVAQLLSVNSENSQSENECDMNSLKESSENNKPADVIEKLQTNGKLFDVICEHNNSATGTESSISSINCNGKPSFLIDKESYREESDSSIDDESDSSSSSDENSDSSDSSLDFMNKKNNIFEEKKQSYSVKTKGELGLEDLPPIEELSITVLEKESELIGKVHSIVEQLVVVRAIKGLAPIDLDSVLFLSHDQPLGHVFDVFGPIAEPFYSVRFNAEDDIKAKLIEIGMDVYYAPGRSDVTKFVFVDQLRNQKGSDASWAHNNEPPVEFLDFSNDEEEKSAKKERRKKKRDRENDDDEDNDSGKDGDGNSPPDASIITGKKSVKRERQKKWRDRGKSNEDVGGGVRRSSPDISIITESQKSYSPPSPNPPRYRTSVSRSPFTNQSFIGRNVPPSISPAPGRFYATRAQVNNFTVNPRVSSPFNPTMPPPTPFSPYNQRPEHQFGQMSNPRLFSPAPAQSPGFQSFVHIRQTPSITPASFSRTPPSFARTPPVFVQTPPFTQTPHSFVQTPPVFVRTSPSFTQTSPSFTQTPAVLVRTQSSFMRTPPVIARTPPIFTPTPPPINQRPTVFFSHSPNFMRPQILSPQVQPNISPNLMCVPSSPMTSNVPPPNVPLSIQVPPNYLNSPPPVTPTMPGYSSPQPVFYNPPYRFHNNRV